jgi:hypothetical protein
MGGGSMRMCVLGERDEREKETYTSSFLQTVTKKNGSLISAKEIKRASQLPFKLSNPDCPTDSIFWTLAQEKDRFCFQKRLMSEIWWLIKRSELLKVLS